jgi:hypothetical protein
MRKGATAKNKTTRKNVTAKTRGVTGATAFNLKIPKPLAMKLATSIEGSKKYKGKTGLSKFAISVLNGAV